MSQSPQPPERPPASASPLAPPRPWRGQMAPEMQTRLAAISAAETSAEILAAIATSAGSATEDPIQLLLDLLQAQAQALSAQRQEMVRLTREVAVLTLEMRALRDEIHPAPSP